MDTHYCTGIEFQVALNDPLFSLITQIKLDAKEIVLMELIMNLKIRL